MVLGVDWLVFGKVPNLMGLVGMGIVTLSVIGISCCDAVTDQITRLFKGENDKSKDLDRQETTRV